MSKAELNCCWHFAKSLGGQDQGPNDAMGENFKKSPFDSLVREAIQNSIDAQVDPDVPVIVTFSFRNTTSRNYPELFDIRRHIRGCLDMYNDESAQKKFQPMLDYLSASEYEKMDYLEVSDENTTGMPYTKGDTKSPFYSFVQSAGNSSKSTSAAGGSFGFGKAAYFNVSKIRTILISTLTEDGNHYFQGVAALCTHMINGEKREPVGYYGNYNKPEPVEEEPIRNPDEIPNKFSRTTKGTSMYIIGLGLSDSETDDAIHEIEASVIKHFWLAIIRRKLIVKVTKGFFSTEIDANNIVELAERIFPDYDDKRRGHGNPRPYIDAVINAGSDDKHFVFEKDIPLLGKCAYYLIKSKNGNDYILNMRSTFMLINHSLNRTDYGFYSIFVCTDDDGNEILRMSENPAHTEWDVGNAPPQDKSVVRDALKAKDEFIQECIRSVFVSSDVEVLDFGGLDEYLSIPMSLDDEDYNPNLGKPTDKTTPEATASTNTEINEEPTTIKPHVPTLGDVVIKNPPSPKNRNQGGNEEPTGHTPEITQPTPEPDPDDSNDAPEGPDKPDEPDKPEGDNPRGPEANDNPGPVVPEDGGEPLPNPEPLRISYRTFAQNGPDGFEHRLVVHSNRASSKVVITIISGGETSDEPIAVSRTDNGNIINNRLTHVHLDKGRTIIRVWFADDMRHAIKLNVYENQ